MSNLYNTLCELTSTLSNEYHSGSYSPFRNESYSPSRVIDNDEDYDPDVLSNEISPLNQDTATKVVLDELDVKYKHKDNEMKTLEYTNHEYLYKSQKRSRSPINNHYSHQSQKRSRSPINDHYSYQSQKRLRSPMNNHYSFKSQNLSASSSNENYSYKSSNFQDKKEYTAFVCNIAFTIPEEELKEFFESRVRVQSFKLVDQKNEQGKLCKRFAFVSTFTQLDFDNLLSLHDTMIDNRKLCIRKSDKK